MFEEETKGGFEKEWFWRMYPRSGFWYRGTSECTLVPVLGTEQFLFRAKGPKPIF